MTHLNLARVGALAIAVVLLAALAPAASAQTGTGPGWGAYYYNWVDDNLDCNAPPPPNMYRIDPAVNFFWPEYTSPGPGIRVDNYTVCWGRVLYFETSGNWTVTTLNDDGMNVWVNGKIAMHAWYDQGPSWHTGTIYLNAGHHLVTVKYYNRTLGGVACMAWAREGQPPAWNCPYRPPVQAQPVYPYAYYSYLPVPPVQGGYPYGYYPPVWSPPPAPQPAPYYYPWPQTVLPQGYYPVVPKVQPAAPQYPALYSGCLYVVRRGDNLSAIAHRYGTTVAAIAQLNGIRNPSLIYSGTVLRIPVSTCR